MNTVLLRHWSALLLLPLALSAARAEDIDIYQGTAKGGTANMLIILDNSAAADASSIYTCKTLTVADPTKNFGFEQCGLYNAVTALSSDPERSANLSLGLMYFPPGGTDGGTFVMPAASPPPSALKTMDGPGVTEMLARVSQLSLAKDKSNNNQIAQAMQEAWAFYQGKTGLSGTRYPGLNSQQVCSNNYVLYITLATNNQKPQDGGNRGGNALQAAAQLSAPPAQLPLIANRPSDIPTIKGGKTSYAVAKEAYQSDYADEWADFMFTGTSSGITTPYPSITTYTIILSDGSNPDYEQLMVNMAQKGGGKYFVVQLGDIEGLNLAIGKVFSEVQAVNSVFAAPVLPVSTNAQGTYLNQVFMGMFRPDSAGKPRWVGNVKQYQFGVDTSDPSDPQLFLADASWGPYAGHTNANAALSAAGTGFLIPTATSFWTSKKATSLPDSMGGFWANALKLQGAADGFDAADGQVVEKGGVSQQIRLKYLTDSYGASGTSARNVLTCTTANCVTSGTALNTTGHQLAVANAAALASLGTQTGYSAAQATNLLKWVRGEDTAAVEGDARAGAESSQPPDKSITIRGSVHGDVLHSRPTVVNYGGSTGIVVFYGANDGLFRAVNGNQPNNTADTSKPMGSCTASSDCAIAMTDAKGNMSSVPPGGELWSFVPQEFYPGLKRVYENAPELKLAGSTVGQPKTYFFDGSTSVYQNPATGKVYLFLSARRGGRLLYALDVSDPANPKFMWKRSNDDAGFAELGQTWSQPKVAMIKGHDNPVLIFGAGYDTNEDAEPPTADTMGRGIFVLDAVTGDIVWQALSSGATCASTTIPCKQNAAMQYAVPADITLLDRNYDGKIDRLYAADTGGNIWRVDLEPTGTGLPDTWQLTRLAALGGTGGTKRKFFFPPDVVPTRQYDVITAVSGDREHPLLTQTGANAVYNRFYMIKDTKTGNSAAGWVTVNDDTSSTADTAPTDLFHATATVAYDGSARGFYMTLLGVGKDGVARNGEKGVNAPVTVGGITYFGTNQPRTDTESCGANLGTARSYAVNAFTGTSKSVFLDGGGLAPSPVFGIVTVDVEGKPRQLPFLIGGGGGTGADGRSGLGAEKPKIPVNMRRQRTYWYREMDR